MQVMSHHGWIVCCGHLLGRSAHTQNDGPLTHRLIMSLMHLPHICVQYRMTCNDAHTCYLHHAHTHVCVYILQHFNFNVYLFMYNTFIYLFKCIVSTLYYTYVKFIYLYFYVFLILL